MSLKALIFDVDGTLADTEKYAHLPAFNLTFKDMNLDWHWDDNLYIKLLKITGGKERLKYFIKSYKPKMPKVGNLDEFISKIHNNKTNHYVEIIKNGKLPLRKGVKKLIFEAMANNLKLAIATTTTFINVQSLITTNLGNDAMDYFDVIAAGDIVKNKKPAPDIYNYALNKLNLKADECISFEDSENGMLSATAAGLKSIITVNGYTKKQNFKNALIILDSLGDEECDFKVIKGNSYGYSYVNIKFIRKLYESNY